MVRRGDIIILSIVLCALIFVVCTSARPQQAACSADADCNDSEAYCKKGACNATSGVCTERTTFCTAHYEPVCGCDGNTYGNPCLAGGAGVNIASMGDCPDATPCWNNTDCVKTSLYCAKVSGSCDDTGFCNPRPVECGPEVIPVCGCDGVSYSSECVAASRAVSVKSEGACPITTPCTKTTDCPRFYYCQQMMGCTATTGVCTPVPPSCSDQTDPVCGCDGKTYSNACFASLAGVNLAYRGQCNTTEECSTDGDCDAGLFCQKEVGTCTDPDEVGLCTEMPVECEREGDTVCGCDGITYPNDCYAYAAGINVAKNTACALIQSQ